MNLTWAKKYGKYFENERIWKQFLDEIKLTTISLGLSNQEYIDREGDTISLSLWSVLLSFDCYKYVKRTQKPNHIVVTTWVGFMNGSNFLVELYSKDQHKPIECTKCGTESVALKIHDEFAGSISKD